MYMELKRLDDLRRSELAQVTTAFYAIGQLKSAWAGHLRIRGVEKALDACTHHIPGDWNYKESCRQPDQDHGRRAPAQITGALKRP
jgi:hypothetical protein